MVLLEVTDHNGHKSYYNPVEDHHHRCSYPGLAGSLFNSSVDYGLCGAQGDGDNSCEVRTRDIRVVRRARHTLPPPCWSGGNEILPRTAVTQPDT